MQKVENRVTYSIGEFAKLIGVNTLRLRRWDNQKIFLADRSPLGYRMYTQEHYDRFIKMTKREA